MVFRYHHEAANPPAIAEAAAMIPTFRRLDWLSGTGAASM